MLRVDTREQDDVIMVGKEMFPDLKVEMLDVGDVVYENGGKSFCVERKCIFDFVDSTRDGRLVSQPMKMIENYDYNYIVIVGSFMTLSIDERYANFTQKQYLGKVASLNMKYRMPTITVEDDFQFWELIGRFIAKLPEAGKPLVKPTIVNPNSDDTHVSMLCCIPGVGESKARLILDEFEFWDLPEVSKEELMEIKGIGNGFAEKIMNYARRKDDGKCFE